MVTSKVMYYPELKGKTLCGHGSEASAIKEELYRAILDLAESNTNVASSTLPSVAWFIINNYDDIKKEMEKDRRAGNRFVQTSIVAPRNIPPEDDDATFDDEL